MLRATVVEVVKHHLHIMTQKLSHMKSWRMLFTGQPYRVVGERRSQTDGRLICLFFCVAFITFSFVSRAQRVRNTLSPSRSPAAQDSQRGLNSCCLIGGGTEGDAVDGGGVPARPFWAGDREAFCDSADDGGRQQR